jgi:hypothetical protein
MKSIFTDKNKMPDDNDLKKSLGDNYRQWQTIKDYVKLKFPNGSENCNCSGYNWSFTIKDKKRAIIYLLPRDKFFKLAFVFGQKATEKILQGQISGEIKKQLESARVYAEGLGIRIEIKNDLLIQDIKELIDIN